MLNKAAKLPLKNTGRYLTWRLLSITVMGLLLGSIMGAAYVLYLNVYATIAESDMIMVLTSNLNLSVVNVRDYEQNKKMIELKKSETSIPRKLRNIFIYGSAPTTTVASSSPQS